MELDISFSDLCDHIKTLEFAEEQLKKVNRVLNMSCLEAMEYQLHGIETRLATEGRKRELRAGGKGIWRFRWSWCLFPKHKGPGGKTLPFPPSYPCDYQAEALDEALKHKDLFPHVESKIPEDGHFSVLHMEASLRKGSTLPPGEIPPCFEVRFVDCPGIFASKYGTSTLGDPMKHRYSEATTPEDAAYAVFQWYNSKRWVVCDSDGPQYMVLKTFCF